MQGILKTLANNFEDIAGAVAYYALGLHIGAFGASRTALEAMDEQAAHSDEVVRQAEQFLKRRGISLPQETAQTFGVAGSSGVAAAPASKTPGMK